MLAIAYFELKQNLRSIKSIFIMFVILLFSLGFAHLTQKYQSFFDALNVGDELYILGLTFTLLFVGPFFVFGLNHDAINSEIKNRTIRFLATKTSRTEIVIGKFFSSSLFWFVCLLIPVTIISITYKNNLFLEGLTAYSFMLYFISLSLLLSSFIDNMAITNFLGIFLSLIMTIMGVLSTSIHNWYIDVYSYITPYHYYLKEDITISSFTPIIFSAVFLIICIIILKKRDL